MAGPSARVWKVLGIVVVILVVVLIAADRGGVYLAEYEAGKTIQDSQHLASRPDVDLDGIPFLTQLVAGDFDKVTIDADDLAVALGVKYFTRDLNLEHMHVVLQDVDVSRSFDSFHTGTADATALIAYGDLGDTLGAKLSYRGNGRVQGSKSITVPVLGSQTATLSGVPRLVGQSLHFDDLQITPQIVAKIPAVQSLLSRDVPLTGIPFGLKVTSLTVDADGVHLSLHGKNVSYSS